MTAPYVIPNELEAARAFWSDVARRNDWHREPMPVQVWVDEAGHVLDSVAYTALTHDIVVRDVDDENDDEDDEALDDLLQSMREALGIDITYETAKDARYTDD